LVDFVLKPKNPTTTKSSSLAEERDVRVTARIPCAIIDRVSTSPLSTFEERLHLSSRNLAALAAVVQMKFSAGQFRDYRCHDGGDRWIVLERGDLTGPRLR
jgi:hypothetical protein